MMLQYLGPLLTQWSLTSWAFLLQETEPNCILTSHVRIPVNNSNHVQLKVWLVQHFVPFSHKHCLSLNEAFLSRNQIQTRLSVQRGLNHLVWLRKTLHVILNESHSVHLNEESGVLRVGGISLTRCLAPSLSFPPSYLDCYLSRSSRCVLITTGLRKTQLGDEAHFSLIKVGNLLYF